MINDGLCGHCGQGDFKAVEGLVTCCNCGVQHALVASHVVPLRCNRPTPASEPPKKTGFYLVYAQRKFWATPVWQLGSFSLRVADRECVWVADDSDTVLEVTHWLPMPPDPE